MMDEATCATQRALVEKGTFGGGLLETGDCKKAHEELAARGVEFAQPPTERPYGIEALLKDDPGNWFSMTQRENPRVPTSPSKPLEGRETLDEWSRRRRRLSE